MIKPTEDSEKCLKKVGPDFASVKKITRYVFLGAPGKKPQEIEVIQELLKEYSGGPLLFKGKHYTDAEFAGVHHADFLQDAINEELIDKSHYALFIFYGDSLGSLDKKTEKYFTVIEWERACDRYNKRDMDAVVPFFHKEVRGKVKDFKEKFKKEEENYYKACRYEEYEEISELEDRVRQILMAWGEEYLEKNIHSNEELSFKENIKNALEQMTQRNFGNALSYWREAGKCANGNKEEAWSVIVRIRIKEKSYEEAIQELQKATESESDGKENFPWSKQSIAWAWFMTGLVEDQLGNSQQKALEAYDEVIKRFKDAENLFLKKIVVQALHNKEAIFIKSEQKEEAIKSCEQLVELFKDESDCFVRQLVGLSLYKWGSILCQQKKYKEAIEIFDKFYKKFGEENHSSIRTLLYDVLHNKACSLASLEKFDEAIDICDQIIKEAIKESEDVSDDRLTLSFIIERSKEIFYGDQIRRAYDDKLSFLVNKASTKDEESSKEEALGLCEKVIREFKDVDIEKLCAREQEIAIKAFLNKGKVLEDLFENNSQEKDRNEAFKTYEEAIEKFNNVKVKEDVVGVLAYILLNKGRMLREMGKENDALEVLDEVITRFGGKEDLDLEVWVVGAYVEKGIIFDNKHNYKKALECYNYVIICYEKTRQDLVQDFLKMAIQNAIVDLRDNIKCDQCLLDLCKRVRRIWEKNSNLDSVFGANVKSEEERACARLSKKEKTDDAHYK